MKITSQQVGSGKLGNAVYSQVGGECIAREYNPNVSNPSTVGQITQRSKFKLMSQLSASLKPSLAIRKEGLKSARNIFTSINNGKVVMVGNDAQVNLNKIQITKSNRGLADFTADRSSGTEIALRLAETIASNLDAVVYAAFTKEADGTLMQFASVKCDTAGTPAVFAASLPYTAKAIVIYAYGMSYDSAKARAAYSNMAANTAEQVAKLYGQSSEIANATTLTMTKGLTMLIGETEGASDNEEHFLVSVSASGNGSVSGGGSFVAGQTATLHATPDEEAEFDAWHLGTKDGEVLSRSADYSFEVQQSVTIVGVFLGGPTPKYQINASVNPANAGSVNGGGQKEEGSTCTLTFTPAAGSQLVFDGWYENGNLVSSANPYSFEVEGARTLVAECVEPVPSGFSDVQYNGADVDQNLTDVAENGTFSGSYAVEGDETHAALIPSNTAPEVGQEYNASGLTAISNDAWSGNVTLYGNQKFYIVVGHIASGNHIIVDAVYDYTITTIDQ